MEDRQKSASGASGCTATIWMIGTRPAWRNRPPAPAACKIRRPAPGRRRCTTGCRAGPEPGADGTNAGKRTRPCSRPGASGGRRWCSPRPRARCFWGPWRPGAGKNGSTPGGSSWPWTGCTCPWSLCWRSFARCWTGQRARCGTARPPWTRIWPGRCCPCRPPAKSRSGTALPPMAARTNRPWGGAVVSFLLRPRYFFGAHRLWAPAPGQPHVRPLPGLGGPNHVAGGSGGAGAGTPVPALLWPLRPRRPGRLAGLLHGPGAPPVAAGRRADGAHPAGGQDPVSAGGRPAFVPGPAWPPSGLWCCWGPTTPTWTCGTGRWCWRTRSGSARCGRPFPTRAPSCGRGKWWAFGGPGKKGRAWRWKGLCGQAQQGSKGHSYRTLAEAYGAFRQTPLGQCTITRE